MTALSKRQRNALETSEKILHIGKQLIDEHGYEAVTVSQIAKAANVSLGTFYHYFKSKEELYFTHSQVDSIELDDMLVDRASSLSFKQRMHDYLVGYFDIMASNSVNFLAYWLGHTSTPDPDLRKYYLGVGNISDIATDHRAAIYEWLQNGIEDNDLKEDTPTTALAQTIYSSMIGMMVVKCLTNDGVNLHEWAETFYGVIFNDLLSAYLVEK